MAALHIIGNIIVYVLFLPCLVLQLHSPWLKYNNLQLIILIALQKQCSVAPSPTVTYRVKISSFTRRSTRSARSMWSWPVKNCTSTRPGESARPTICLRSWVADRKSRIFHSGMCLPPETALCLKISVPQISPTFPSITAKTSSSYAKMHLEAALLGISMAIWTTLSARSKEIARARLPHSSRS